MGDSGGADAGPLLLRLEGDRDVADLLHAPLVRADEEVELRAGLVLPRLLDDEGHLEAAALGVRVHRIRLAERGPREPHARGRLEGDLEGRARVHVDLLDRDDGEDELALLPDLDLLGRAGRLDAVALRRVRAGLGLREGGSGEQGGGGERADHSGAPPVSLAGTAGTVTDSLRARRRRRGR